MSEFVLARCGGLPVEIHGREMPTEYDLLPPCGWMAILYRTSVPERCPGCSGTVETVEEEKGGADAERLDQTARSPLAWAAEQAAELDRLAVFEVAIRNALKPWTWSGIDADGKSYKDVVDEVSAAVVALEQDRGQP